MVLEIQFRSAKVRLLQGYIKISGNFSIRFKRLQGLDVNKPLKTNADLNLPVSSSSRENDMSKISH